MARSNDETGDRFRQPAKRLLWPLVIAAAYVLVRNRLGPLLGAPSLGAPSLLGLLLLLLLFLSLAWTTWKGRQLLRRALGRKLRGGEEMSIKSWMAVGDTELDAAVRELQRNPFEAAIDTTDRLGRGLSDHSDHDLSMTAASDERVNQRGTRIYRDR